MARHEQSSVTQETRTSAIEQSAPVSEAEVRGKVEQRLNRNTHHLAKLAFMAFLGLGSESGTGQTLQEKQREAMEIAQDPGAARRLQREEIQRATGRGSLAVMDGYRRKGTTETPTAQEQSERRERERVRVEGFEALGYSSEVIRQELERILPAEWMNAQNVRVIRFSSDPPPNLPGGYGMEGHREAAHCTRSQQPGQPSEITVFGNAIGRDPESPYRHAIFLQTLIHEIAHANDPLNSSTLTPAERQAQYQWVAQRVLAMEHGDNIGEHPRRYEFGLTQIRNAIDAWSGDRYASPEGGEGYLPLSYPRDIQNKNRETRNELRIGEYFAETSSLVLTLPYISAFVSQDRTMRRERTAIQLTSDFTYRMDQSWRGSSDAHADAMAHIAFVERIMPDVGERQEAVRQAIVRMEGNNRLMRAGDQLRTSPLGEQVFNLLQPEGSPNGPSFNWLTDEAPRIREQLARTSPQSLTEFDEVVARFQQEREGFRAQGEAHLQSPEARLWYRQQWVPFLQDVMHAKREMTTHPEQTNAILARLRQAHQRVQTTHDALVAHLPADQQTGLEQAIRLETWLHGFGPEPQNTWSTADRQKLTRVYDVIYAHLDAFGADDLIRARTDMRPERLEQLIATGH